MAWVRRGLLGIVVLGALALALAPRPWSLPTGPGFADVEGRHFPHMVAIAMYWVAALNVVLALVLALTVPIWGRAFDRLPDPPARRARRGLYAAGVAFAIGLAALTHWPLVGDSLWWDEAWSIDQAVVGPVEPDPDDPATLDHRPRSWARTLWYYAKPTNHVTYNLLARAAVDVERRLSGRPAWQFSDHAFRLPAFLASLASVAVLAVWIARTGFPLAGLAAASLMALHPWHLRHAGTGRAYTLSLLFALLSAATLTRALEDPRWRWWLAYAAAIGLLMWTQPVNVYLAVALTLCAAVALATRPWSLRDRATGALRFVIANVLAGMVYLQVTAPHVAQALAWTDVVQEGETVTEAQVRDIWTWVSVGVPDRMARQSPHHAEFPAVLEWATEAPWVDGFVYVGLPLLAAIGALRFALRARCGRAALGGFLLATPLVLVVTWHGQMYFYSRFVFYEVAAACALFALGVEALVRLVPWPSRAAATGAVTVALVVGVVAFQLFVLPQSRILLERPYAPSREVAELIHGEAGADPGSVLRAGYGLGTKPVKIYDPWVRYTDDVPQLRALEAEAVREGKPLFVFYGYPSQNERKRPEGITYLEESGRYAVVRTLQGIEPQFTYRIFRFEADAPGS